MKSKTIILSSPKKIVNNSPRAIVTFISDNKNIEGKLRLYNLDTLPPASKLGIYYNSQVYSANLIKKDGAFSFYINENFNLDNNIYCAIIDKANNNDVVLCGGTSNNFEYSINEIEDSDTKETSMDYETEKVIDECIDSFEESTTEKDIKIDDSQKKFTDENCNNCANCDNCVYKDYFYSHQKRNEDVELFTDEPLKSNNKLQNNLNENDENKILESKDIKVNELSQNLNTNDVNHINTLNKESEKFIQSITDQLDDMFKTYPEDNTIMKIIPNSKVIKVTDSVDHDSYIVGVIYENNEIKYLLYGVPSKYNESAPKELGENYQWLPLSIDDPMSDGYYLLYQDASNGKIVPIIVE